MRAAPKRNTHYLSPRLLAHHELMLTRHNATGHGRCQAKTPTCEHQGITPPTPPDTVR